MAIARAGRLAVVLVLAACSSGATQHPPTVAPDTAEIPLGYGTLRRDEIAVRFASDQLDIQVLPLHEGVIRLLAPDTYRSLRQLIQSQQPAIESAARSVNVRHPSLVMVTFSGVVPQARFVPDDVNITSRGRLYRPLAIVPLSPQWSSQQIDPREQASAIYLFDEGIAFREALTVTYQRQSNDAWAASVRLLEREHARVLTRARGAPPPDE
ncbi:MAG: hypothetical protein ACREMV_06605 [Gemmatimonadales bacterium]